MGRIQRKGQDPHDFKQRLSYGQLMNGQDSTKWAGFIDWAGFPRGGQDSTQSYQTIRNWIHRIPIHRN